MNEKELQVAEKIKGMLVENLRIPEEELDYEIALFGDGIGLDSVDSLTSQALQSMFANTWNN